MSSKYRIKEKVNELGKSYFIVMRTYRIFGIIFDEHIERYYPPSTRESICRSDTLAEAKELLELILEAKKARNIVEVKYHEV